MSLRVVPLHGIERLEATTAVLQRSRAADGFGGVWDAADVQWWWRRPRPTDEVPLPVWFDIVGPAAAVGLTAWGSAWQPDAFAVPGIVDISDVWFSALDLAAAHAPSEQLEVLIREDDELLSELAIHAGFQATADSSGLTWMGADQRPPVSEPSDGFLVVDRSMRPGRPHPMIGRNGDQVEARLRQCSLYDPTLDLSVEAPDGTVAGYALFWLDPATGVGMLEPMRVEDVFQRRGLARALLTAGLDRLATKGAQRFKVGFDSEAGRSLYLGAGFVETTAVRAFTRRPNSKP
jgi:GNAT superfamily N-acetyltransferase